MFENNNRKVIKDVSVLPLIGETRFIYHNTTNGYNYLWNEVEEVFIKSGFIPGSNNHVPKFDATNTLEDSQIYDDGTNVGIGTTSPSQKLEVAGRALVNEFQYTKGVIIGGADLNTITDAGFYFGSALISAPDAVGWYFVTVERHTTNDWVHQTATSFGAGNTANLIYTRVKAGGTWTTWRQIITSSDISGTTNYVSKFTGSNSLSSSQIFDNGTNVGVGTDTPVSTIETAGSFGARIRSSATSLTTLSTDYTIVMTAAITTVTLETPSTTTNRRVLNIKNGSTGNITITGNIDGTSQTLTLTQKESRTFHSNGSTWWII
jgi:hypothetical protein